MSKVVFAFDRVNRFADRFVLKCGVVIGLLLPMTGILCQAGDSKTIDDETSPPENALTDYFSNWFARASAIQADQPHWITPLVTTTGRLEEKFRYDLMWESLRGGETLANYGGSGSKGL